MGNKKCCCFNTAWGSIIFVTGFVLMSGIVIYFIFPAPPQITTTDPTLVPNTEPTINNQPITVGTALTLSNTSQLLITYPMSCNVSVYSPSYLDLGFQNIEIKGFLLSNDTRQFDFTGKANITDKTFPSRQTTEFILVKLINSQ